MVEQCLEWLLRLWRGCSLTCEPGAIISGAGLSLDELLAQLSRGVIVDWRTGVEAADVPPATLEAVIGALRTGLRQGVMALDVNALSNTNHPAK